MIKRCVSIDQPGWLLLREALWPDCPGPEHEAEMASIVSAADVSAADSLIAFIAYDVSGEAIGLIEAAIRNDYVNGTLSSPVVFLEGIYVMPDNRLKGIARKMVATLEQWGSRLGHKEFASDALLDNTQSHAMHRALGFQETERVVFFRKVLP